MKEYTVLAYISGLKGDSDDVRYSVEPAEGGGIEFEGSTIGEVLEYLKSVGGVIAQII